MQFLQEDEKEKTEIFFPSPFVHSSKTKFIQQQILRIRQTCPDDKIVIFSQFNTQMKYLVYACEEVGVPTIEFHARLSLDERIELLEEFRTNTNIHVIVTSLKLAAYGLNLTAANHCILDCPWWNPQVFLCVFFSSF